jgi:penicillin-binding protein 2A
VKELRQDGSHKGNKNKKSVNKNKRKNTKLIVFSIIMTILLSSIVLVGFMGLVLARNYEIDESKLLMWEATTIYDRNNQPVESLFVENRKYIPIQEINPLLPEAFLAVEDQRFYQHQGIDLRAIVRALYKDIIARSKVEGGSTITQQLVKNVFLHNEKKWLRKTEEVLIAIKLERKYTKDQILEMYLNYIYFGHGAHGIGAAAQVYFDKTVEELTLAEIAMLAALPKAPNNYSPLRANNEDRSEQRRKLVLRLMEDQGKITSKAREEAENSQLELNIKGVSKNPALLTYVDMILEEAEKQYGISSDEIMIGGYEIHTALDLKAQEAMYEALDVESKVSNDLFPTAGPEQIVQGSMVMMEQQTGAIVAIMGGRDYVRKGLNRATSDVRQPGSTFKPIAVYAPALETGWHPYDLVNDEQIEYGGYKPRNYDGKYRGEVPMLEALQWSYNAPAVWLLNQIGIDKGVSYSSLFGFDGKRELGLALGNVGASPLQMADAYSAFANQGIMMEPYLIEKIIDREGVDIGKRQLKYQQVVSAQTAWYMTKMLETVVKEGTGKRAQLKHPVAGKTGTTQVPSGHKGVRDAWFVGYTPYYTAAVWMGFDKLDKSHVMDSSGGNHPAKVFNYVMERTLADRPVLGFEKPQGVEELKPPVRLDPIQDLTAFVTLYSDLSVSVDLEFTPTPDERAGYTIYRTDEATGEQKVIAENLTTSQLINETGWVDKDVYLHGKYSYVVVVVNLETGQFGEESNRVYVEVTPTYPLFRREGQLDPEDFNQWLEDLVDDYNEGNDEENGQPVNEGEQEQKKESGEEPTEESPVEEAPAEDGPAEETPPKEDNETEGKT